MQKKTYPVNGSNISEIPWEWKRGKPKEFQQVYENLNSLSQQIWKSYELVASFQESRRCIPWPWWRASAADDGVAVRKMRGTLWERVRRNGHDHCLFYSCAPEVYWLPMHALSPDMSIVWVGEKHLQRVTGLSGY